MQKTQDQIGGGKPGPGRPKGARNKKTKQQLKEVEETGETPLQYMLRVMRDAENELEQRMEAAKAAAPYVHPRLSSLEVSGEVRKTIAREPLSPEEYRRKHGVEAPVGPSARPH